MKATCQGKDECFINNLAWYVDFTDTDFNREQCAAPLTQMFVQTACVLSSEEKGNRQVTGLLLSCLIVFMSLSIINYLDFVKKV